MPRDYGKEIEQLQLEKEASEIQAGWEKLESFPFRDYDGQQVLVAHNVLEPLNFDVPPNRQRYVSRTTQYLGLLKEPYIVRKEQQFGVVTSKHVLKADNAYRTHQWELGEKPVELNLFYLRNLSINQRPTEKDILEGWVKGETFEGVRLYVGNDIVSGVFRSAFDVPKEVLENNPERYLDLSYVDALNLLGLEAPEDFKKLHDSIEKEKRLGVLTNIRYLVSNDLALQREVDKLEKAIKEGNAFRIDHARESLQNKKRIQMETHEGIRAFLKRAVELDMHKSEQDLELEFGTRIPLGRYVREVSGYYKFEIPPQ